VKPSSAFIALLMAIGAVVATPRVEAVALKTDGKWYGFKETYSSDGNTPVFEQVWTFESKSAVKLCLLDLYVVGDRFEVTHNGQVLGETGLPTSIYTGDFAKDPEAALKLKTFSEGCWLLAPGSHSITLRTIQRPIGTAFANAAGGVALRAELVPEGGSGLVLLGAALAGLAGLRRWQSSQRTQSL
jgi:hypothetical protein